jgi:hypothetical protein
MKLTFIKLSTGKLSEKNVLIPSVGKTINKQKDLLYFYDMDDKDATGHYKLKSCRISKIVSHKTNEYLLKMIKSY